MINKDNEAAWPAWLKRYDGTGEDGNTPLTKQAWRAARAAHVAAQSGLPKAPLTAPSLTAALLAESISLLQAVLPLATEPALRDRIVAHGAALETVHQRVVAHNTASAARMASVRSHIKGKRGMPVTLRLTSPTGAEYTVHSYKAASAMLNRKPESLKAMMSQRGGERLTVGRGEDTWLMEKVAR